MFYFMSGLPRSGSTVLSAILNQNPNIHSTTTSGLISLVNSICYSWNNNPTLHVQEVEKTDIYNMIQSVVKSKYSNVKKKIIIDKNRGWANPETIEMMKSVLDNPVKIIATVRDIPDCVSSFVRLMKPIDLQNFISNSQLIQHLKYSHSILHLGYEKYPECFHLIHYDNLLSQPQKELNKIHDFLEIPKFNYDFNNIDTKVVAERDEKIWGIKNLHKISPILKKQHSQNSKDVLGAYYDYCDPPAIWKKKEKKKEIDIALELSISGKYVEAKKKLLKLHKKNPECHRIAFNLGWYSMKDKKLLEGISFMNRGRNVNIFGEGWYSDKPIWDGSSPGTILYYLEAGLGDQIHAMKYIQKLNGEGRKIVVACSKELIPIATNSLGDKIIVDKNSAIGVHHDFWIPSQMVLSVLGYEFENLDGLPFIQNSYFKNNKKPVVGLRWQGNVKFPHDHMRQFPLNDFFECFKDIDAEFISLQRDDGEEYCPSWVKKTNLEDWEKTQNAISSCDLVISSCTSVAHLSAGMGTETWVLVPSLSYYVWAYPGEKSPYYDSVTLFKQTKINSWKEPFKLLRTRLYDKYKK